MLTCVGLLFIFQCTPAEAPPPAAPYCDIARPIRWSAQDTRATKEQADRENRKWKRLCSAGTTAR
ncbi:hypothetical protein [Methylobacterium iners]|uniref:Uncharacterized protein n=1 Tax=Methylobacterium iners TaxID=418707 RepID=A0ABQ4RRH9_9HYPH|nr:hypothetical protein [Methylobacterium iners]GJD93380.1 hypothetical protein OCOJLMKI_0574 [Methylobacterium iners]